LPDMATVLNFNVHTDMIEGKVVVNGGFTSVTIIILFWYRNLLTFFNIEGFLEWHVQFSVPTHLNFSKYVTL
jgi:hypothetical protein